MFPHTAPRGGPQRSLRLQRGHLISQGDFTGDFTGDGHPSSPPGKPVGVAAAQVPSGTLQYLEESILMKSLSGQRAGGIPRGLCEASVPRLLPESQPLALLPTCLPGSTSLPSVCQEGIPLTNTPPPSHHDPRLHSSLLALQHLARVAGWCSELFTRSSESRGIRPSSTRLDSDPASSAHRH